MHLVAVAVIVAVVFHIPDTLVDVAVVAVAVVTAVLVVIVLVVAAIVIVLLLTQNYPIFEENFCGTFLQNLFFDCRLFLCIRCFDT